MSLAKQAYYDSNEEQREQERDETLGRTVRRIGTLAAVGAAGYGLYRLGKSTGAAQGMQDGVREGIKVGVDRAREDATASAARLAAEETRRRMASSARNSAMSEKYFPTFTKAFRASRGLAHEGSEAVAHQARQVTDLAARAGQSAHEFITHTIPSHASELAHTDVNKLKFHPSVAAAAAKANEILFRVYN